MNSIVNNNLEKLLKHSSSDISLDFPPKTLLETGNLPIEQIADLSLREGHRPGPLYCAHRWFARRPASQFRSIITALTLKENEADKFWERYLSDIDLKGLIILDPFVGGGTSLIESRHCNARVIGYDIDPVASFITGFELSAASFQEDNPLLEVICNQIKEKISKYHKTKVEGTGECDVLHHFWVQVYSCPECNYKFELHPNYQLAYNKKKQLQWVFCKDCYSIYEISIEESEVNCCSKKTRIKDGTFHLGKATCPSCKFSFKIASQELNGKKPEWKLFAQEYILKKGKTIHRKFKSITERDLLLFHKAEKGLKKIEEINGPFSPGRPVPSDRIDPRPINYGFTEYSDLFNKRQQLHLNLLGKEIKELTDKKSKIILSLAFSDHLAANCMYTGYAFGYRRTSPLFSYHSFRHVTRPVEINPWLNGIGRGTFPNALNKVRKAIKAAKSPTLLNLEGIRTTSPTKKNVYSMPVSNFPEEVLQGEAKAAIKTQSSEKLYNILDNSIDLILTDPPYFDNISYSELSDFYLAWQQVLEIAVPPYNNSEMSSPIIKNLAITKRSEEALEEYAKKLKNIFSECNRVLKKQGRCIFTYHHKEINAWYALGKALTLSGLKCTSVIPMRGEGKSGLHSHNGTIKWDAVFICKKTDKTPLDIDKKIFITKNSLSKAIEKAKIYESRLVSDKSIGFRKADFINLLRAFIVSYSSSNIIEKRNISLKSALKKILGDV